MFTKMFLMGRNAAIKGVRGAIAGARNARSALLQQTADKLKIAKTITAATTHPAALVAPAENAAARDKATLSHMLHSPQAINRRSPL